MDWTSVDRAAVWLSERGVAPDVVIVAGSGLGVLADGVAGDRFAYADIEGFPPAGVQSHAGTLVVGDLRGARVAILSGRAHVYEGHTPADAALPVAALSTLGAKTLIVTNAAGGIRQGLEPGDLVLIEDHISLGGLSGLDPMRGPDPRGRFTPMTEAYAERLLLIAENEARAVGLALPRGIYGFAAGPSFETPAEVRVLRTLGADLVGMSTVPEVIAAKAAGLDVLGISMVTNRAADRRGIAAEHLDDIWAVAERTAPVLADLVTRVVAKL